MTLENLKALKLWTVPDSWAGKPWHDHYVFLGRNRDADCLTESNFEKGLEAIGGESDTVHVVHEGHWACGWIEWIAIHKSDLKALEIADSIACALEDYPVLDENDFSEREQIAAEETWKRCYTPKERIKYIRENKSQFEFRSFADLLGCVRGNYFAGYASELLY